MPISKIGTNSIDQSTPQQIGGVSVGQGAGAVSTNTAVGNSALAANTTGASNTATGFSALAANTTASYNTAAGYQAGYSNTTGYNLVALGYQALYSNTTGYENTAVGKKALYANTTGVYNTAVGLDALASNTNAVSNTAVGMLTLNGNTTGSNNTAMGQQALYLNTTASYNTAVGYKAGYSNVTGAYNTLIGPSAGYSLTSGGNTFVGAAGYYVTTGANNTILGCYNGNQGGLDIRTSNNNIVLSDGDGNPRAFWTNVTGNYSWIFSQQTTPRITAASEVIQVDTNSTGYGIFITGTSGTTAVRFYNQTVPGVVGSISFSGSTTTYSTSSDYRLKENVQPMVGALARVASLKPVTYTWKADGLEGEGFIAHELAEVFPQAVVGEKDATNEDGSIKPQGIDTSFLVATLTAAIQELKADLDATKAELAALKGQP